jgi:HEAT repeat protein
MATASAKRIGVGVLAVVAAAGGYAAYSWKDLSLRLTASQFRSATTAETRADLAAKLLAAGDAGVARLIDVLRSGSSEQCAAIADAVSQHLDGVPPDDPRFTSVCRLILSAADTFSDPGTDAALHLLPYLLRCGTPDAADRCRALAKCGLGRSAEVKIRVVRAAVSPQLGLRAELVPLLTDPSAEVRRAAMAAVGPAGAGEPVIDTEDLFRWLNDPDDMVRALCEAALTTRGLEPEQIDAGRKLTHPEASERLGLLADLERGRADVFRDPGPWLERLSRDPDPAVRAAAARVGFESRLTLAGWLDRLIQDPDPTVRRIATYHRGRAEQLKQAGFGESR